MTDKVQAKKGLRILQYWAV